VRVVVVGASLAGVRTVQALRRLGFDGSISVVDARHAVPCDRPPLSKAVLADASAEPRPVADAASLDADLLLGERAVDLDTAAREVGLHGGRRLRYDALVVASGSAPRTIPGFERALQLRTEDDALALRAALTPGARVVIVGGGFIGAEVAWTASRLGCAVTIVEPLPALMVRGLGPELSEVFTRRHEQAGVVVRTGVGAVGFDGTAVSLSDGSVVPADLVLVAVGTAPETAWLRDSGLDIANGVLCDGRLAALDADGLPVPGVWAAGDVARWHSGRYGGPVRVEHWTNAVEHAPVVAANIHGTPTAYDGVPYVWTDQLGARLQIFGRVRPQDEVRYVLGGPEDDTFVAVTGGPDGLQAAVGFGAVKQVLAYRKLLVAGAAMEDL
jgi:3-phenylpropionate/trans-cinnamate dioxygenase ferredoxin reductase subunit